MKNCHVVIVGNGNITENFLKRENSADFVISVVRATLYLIDRGVIPDIAIGDFDSVSLSELEIIKKKAKKTIIYKREKDETDLDLAVMYSIVLSQVEVTIIGATGKRLDHELANIYLLKKYLDKDINAHIIDANNKITLIDKKTIIHKDKKYNYLSLISYTDHAVVSISGCRYNISKKTLLKGSSLGVSNEIIDGAAQIDVHRGILIMIQSRD